MSCVQPGLIALGMAIALPVAASAVPSPTSGFHGPNRAALPALGQRLAAPRVVNAAAQPDRAAAATVPAQLRGTWRSAPDETPLVSALQVSVWGDNAREIRTVNLVVRPDGTGTLTIHRRIVDARGRTAPASTSVEAVDLVVGDVVQLTAMRTDYAVAVRHAERRYPDEPSATWTIDGMRVGLFTRADLPDAIEIRVETPEGRGSFWETLRRGAARSANTLARR